MRWERLSITISVAGRDLCSSARQDIQGPRRRDCETPVGTGWLEGEVDNSHRLDAPSAPTLILMAPARYPVASQRPIPNAYQWFAFETAQGDLTPHI